MMSALIWSGRNTPFWLKYSRSGEPLGLTQLLLNQAPRPASSAASCDASFFLKFSRSCLFNCFSRAARQLSRSLGIPPLYEGTSGGLAATGGETTSLLLEGAATASIDFFSTSGLTLVLFSVGSV